MSALQENFRVLVDAPDAFDQLARICVAEESTESVLHRVAEVTKRTIPHVAEASVTLISNDKARSAAHTGPLALHLDQWQYGCGHGPCLESAIGQEVREITDARTERRWPGYARVAVTAGSLSSMSVPLPVEPTVHGALNLYATPAGAFDDDARALARTLASYAAVAVGNVHLYETTRQRAENLDIAMQHRAVIEQAKGILMSQRRCDAATAFTILAGASQRSNRKLRDIAKAIVESVSEPGE